MIINLNIKENSREVIFINTCNSYTSPSGKYTWTASGTYNDTIQNSIGCDSVLVIGLVINQGSTSTINPTACLKYTSPSGKYVWYSSGTYQDTLQGSNGCDSIINVNLTINQVDTSVTVNQNILIANANSATYQWINCNNGPIAGETNKSLTVTSNGDYAVIVGQNNCSDTSACIQVINSGIDEYQNNTAFKVYPNPSSGKLFIESEEISELKIVSITGKVVLEKIDVDKAEIDISHLNNGVYFLQLKSPNGTYNRKIVLAR